MLIVPCDRDVNQIFLGGWFEVFSPSQFILLEASQVRGMNPIYTYVYIYVYIYVYVYIYINIDIYIDR